MEFTTENANVKVTVSIEGLDTYTYDDICKTLDLAKIDARQILIEMGMY